MIVVDTSALMAIALEEPAAGACVAALQGAGSLLIAAPTLAETLIVAAGRGVGAEMARLLARLDIEVVAADGDTARRVAGVYARWSKGNHPAALSFADCFAYDVARERGAPLLYVGDYLARTDVEGVL